MTMKRFMAIHSFHSDETKAAIAAMTSDDPTTQKEWAASWKFEKCQCVATWIGNDDFFYCHWLAETDKDIHNALRKMDLMNLFLLPVMRLTSTLILLASLMTGHFQ